MKYLTLICTILCLSCFESNPEKIKTEPVETDLAQPQYIVADTIKALLVSTTSLDTLDFDNFSPFVFFQAGHLFDKFHKNAVSFNALNDTTFLFKLYEVYKDGWSNLDSLIITDILPLQFELEYEDYNFDNQKDIYIQFTASNGYSISKGQLIIVNPISRKLELHPEARELGNMKPDPIRKVVITETWTGYDPKTRQEAIKQFYQWKSGRLVLRR